MELCSFNLLYQINLTQPPPELFNPNIDFPSFPPDWANIYDEEE